jgi:tRNA(Arg) A34 adenosine deaminase TadA
MTTSIDARRRRWLLGAAALGLTRPARGAAPPEQAPFVALAFEMRRRAIAAGDQPYGAVVVCDGRVVGEGVSAVVTRNDPRAHAEIEALRDASRRLGTVDLAGCVLYGSSRACPMCEAEAARMRIVRMYYGDEARYAGVPRAG